MEKSLLPHSGYFTKRKRTSQTAHPLIRRWVGMCSHTRTLRKEVAERSGIDDAVIYNWEAGRKSPKLNDFEVLVVTIGHRLTILIGQDEQELPKPDGVAHPMILWLRRRRLTLGLSQRALADGISRNYSTVSGWEAGNHMPKLCDFDAAVKFMGAWIAIREEIV